LSKETLKIVVLPRTSLRVGLQLIWPLKYDTVFRTRVSFKFLNCSCHQIGLPPVLKLAARSTRFAQVTIEEMLLCKSVVGQELQALLFVLSGMFPD